MVSWISHARHELEVEPFHRHRSSRWHCRGHFYRRDGLAIANGINRYNNTQCGCGGARRSPGPWTPHPGEQKLLAPPSRSRRRRTVCARCRPLWMSTLGIVFLAIHAGRMPLTDDLLGRISPIVATAGDILMTFIFAMVLMLPARLAWRRATRAIERLTWTIRLGAKDGAPQINPAADWLIGQWLKSRFSFSLRLRESRASLPIAIILILRLGLPVTAFFVAFNPVWGFSWYFNTRLGDRYLPKTHGTAGRSMARQHGRCRDAGL